MLLRKMTRHQAHHCWSSYPFPWPVSFAVLAKKESENVCARFIQSIFMFGKRHAHGFWCVCHPLYFDLFSSCINSLPPWCRLDWGLMCSSIIVVCSLHERKLCWISAIFYFSLMSSCSIKAVFLLPMYTEHFLLLLLHTKSLPWLPAASWQRCYNNRNVLITQ